MPLALRSSAATPSLGVSVPLKVPSYVEPLPHEGLRALRTAQEQENVAAVQGMRARVIEAEAEVPKAIAAAFREGKLGVMDYYNMQNVISDTEMRNAISKSTQPAKDTKENN